MVVRFSIVRGPCICTFKSKKPVSFFRKSIIRLLFPDVKKQQQTKRDRKGQPDDIDDAKCAVPEQVAPCYFDKIFEYTLSFG